MGLYTIFPGGKSGIEYGKECYVLVSREFLTQEIKASLLHDFSINAQEPNRDRYALTLLYPCPFPVKVITGVSGEVLLTASMTVKPSTPGMVKSVMTRSNGREENSSRAFLPQSAVTTQYPCSSKSRA